MSKTEILEELPKLNSKDRVEVFSFLCDLEEGMSTSTFFPLAQEKVILDKVLEDYIANPCAGSSWEDVRSRIFIKQ